jgi:hypothetical protein
LHQPKNGIADVGFSEDTITSPEGILTKRKYQRENDLFKSKDAKSNRFDDTLLLVIDKTLRQVFGDINTKIIYDHLKRRGCRRCDIPAKPEEFSTGLRNILGSGKGQILGAASILEEAIVETLSAELEIELCNPRSTQFAENIKRLREVYNSRRNNTQSVR